MVAVLPISLIKFKIIFPKFRLFLLIGIFVLVSVLIYLENIPLNKFGMGADNFYLGALTYFVATVVSILFLIILAKIMGNKGAREWYKDPHFLFLFIPISFAQQFLFQGFILYKLNLTFGPLVAVVLTALIFGYMHTIFPKPLFSMILGTIAGLLFATLYTIYPNILMASITHSILNPIAVYFGFFTFRDSEGRLSKTHNTQLNLS